MSLGRFTAYFGAIDLVITDFSYDYSSTTTTVPLRLTNIQVPLRAAQKAFSVSIQTRSEWEYRQAYDFFAKHQNDAISNVSYDPTVRVLYPAKNIDVSGFVGRLPFNAQRFDPAPKITLPFILARDNINTLTSGSSGAPSWDSVIYGAPTTTMDSFWEVPNSPTTVSKAAPSAYDATFTQSKFADPNSPAGNKGLKNV